MKSVQIIRHVLPALTFACALGAAPLAMAQTNAMAPAATTKPATVAPPVTTTPPVTKAVTKPVAAKLPVSDEFKTVAAATTHCPGDVVVWSALSASHSYHLATSKYYGKTTHGAYVCEKDATAAGYHASKE